MINKIEIIKKLLAVGYSQEESEKIFQGYQEIQEGKGMSSEEVYLSLFAKHPVHA